MKINFAEECQLTSEYKEIFIKAGNLALEYAGLENFLGEVSVTIVSDKEMKQLNRDFRNMDKVTDVLSFPQFATIEEIEPDEDSLLGDVVICMSVAEKQAKEFGHSLLREMTYLFVHSIFHLLAMDHMDDKEKSEMRKAEEWVMEKMGISR